VHILRIFGWSFGVTVVVIALMGLLKGPQVAVIVALLAILEISLSFDNAVINATILRRMSEFWQRMFLTVGILIAVFGMRLLFPIVVVALTAGLGPVEVFDLALDENKLHDGKTYSQTLGEAHPAIAAFGGIFLLMIFLDFMFDPEREVRWVDAIERPLQKIGELKVLSSVIALVSLLVVGLAFSQPHGADATEQVLVSGIAGLATYLAVRGLGEFFEARGVGADDEEGEESGADAAATRQAVEPRVTAAEVVRATGTAAFFLFLYLEVIDASFSFDGVVGAFAITSDIFVIAAGLGIGAMYIRSLTVFLVRKGTLQEYIFLEHGAHYAIGALAIILGISIQTDVPEIITGLVGVGFIGLALLSSIRHRRRTRGGGSGEHAGVDDAGTVPATVRP
jgi:hypothetical protein